MRLFRNSEAEKGGKSVKLRRFRPGSCQGKGGLMVSVSSPGNAKKSHTRDARASYGE